MKESLKLALEALEQLDGIDTETECVTIDVGDVITAIKEALAQNSKRPIESDYISQVAYTRALEAYCDALAQPEQEPVAYIHRNEYNEYRLEPHDDFDIKSIPFNVDVPLFKD